MPISYDDVKIEKANEYYLVPTLGNTDSLYYLGNEHKLNAFKIASDASLVLATGGIGSSDPNSKETKCYIYLNTDDAGVKQILQDVDAVLTRNLK